MDCIRLDGKYLFRFLDLLQNAKNESGAVSPDSYKAIYDYMMAHKNEISNTVEITPDVLQTTFKAIGENELGNYIYKNEVESTKPVVDKGKNKVDEDKGLGQPATDSPGAQPLADSGRVKAKVIKAIPRPRKTNDLKQLYRVFFEGYLSRYQQFIQDFNSDVFARTIVDFERGDLVKNADMLNDNIRRYKQELASELEGYLRGQGIQVNYEPSNPKALLEAFAQYCEDNGITNDKVLNSESSNSKEGQELTRAYMDYVSLTNFDGIATQVAGDLLDIDASGKYTLKDERHVKCNFDDNFIDITSEMSHLSEKIITSTPLLDAEGKPVHGRYLQPNQVFSVTNKIKALRGKTFQYQSATIRFSPEENMRNIMYMVLSNKDNMTALLNDGSLNKDDIQLLRSIYNYYYKQEGDDAIVKGLNRNSYSMLQIKSKAFKDAGDIEHNVITTAISSLIDKTIMQKYTTIEMTRNGFVRKLTTEITASKYTGEIKGNLNNSANIDMEVSRDANNPTMLIKGINGYIGSMGYLRLNIDGIGSLAIKSDGFMDKKTGDKIYKGFTSITSSSIKEFLQDGMNGKHLTAEQKTALSLLSLAQAYLNINLFEDNGSALLNNKGSRNFFNQLVGATATIINGRSFTHDYNVAKAMGETNNIESYYNAHKSKYALGNEPISNGLVQPFKRIDNYKDFITSMSNSIATMRGDNYSSIGRNLNGDGVPNSSLLALIHDYKTAFAAASEFDDDTAVSSNFLVNNDNWSIIDGIVYRTDVKSIDGKVKNVKRFNAGEIAYQAVMADFWLAMSDGKILLQPVVFSDKPGQALVSYRINDKIKYEDVDGVVIEGTVKELMNKKSELLKGMNMLDELHFRNQRSQYTKLKNKLILDYKIMISNYIAAEGDNAVVSRLGDIETSIMNILSNGRLKGDFWDALRVVIADQSADIVTRAQRLRDMISRSGKKGVAIDSIMSVLNNTGEDMDDMVLKNIQTMLNAGVKLDRYRKGPAGKVDYQLEFHQSKHNGKSSPNMFLISKFKEYLGKGAEAGFIRKMNKANKKFAVQFADKVGDVQFFADNGRVHPHMKQVLEQLFGVRNVEFNQENIDKFINSWVDNEGNLVVSKTKMVDEDGKTKWVNDPLTLQAIYNENVEIMLNPLFEYMQSSHRLLSQSFNKALVGGEHAHKIKVSKDKALSGFEYGPQSYVYRETFRHLKEVNPRLRDDVIHEMTKDAIWEESEESIRLGAMLKRMVSHQAKLHTITQDLITGIPRKLRMGVMDDVSRLIFNSSGYEKGMDVADGAAYMPHIAAILMKNSIGDAGVDSVSLKAIRHNMDGDTQEAELDKYAVQSVNNEVMRKTLSSRMPWANFNRYFLSTVKLSDVMPNGYDANILAHLYGNQSSDQYNVDSMSDPEAFNQFISSDASNMLPSFMRGITYVEDGKNILTETIGLMYDTATGEYIVKKAFQGPNNNDRGITFESGFTMIPNTNIGYKRIKLDTLYDIWSEVFGGMWSVSEAKSGQFNLNGKWYKYDDSSNEFMAKLMNNVVIKKDNDWRERIQGKDIQSVTMPTKSGMFNQTNYYQPLKEALIWQLNHNSGMKNGAKNVNKTSLAYGDTSQSDYFITDSLWWGIQGNFDHGYSEEEYAEVSEPSQMISAAETMGYNTADINRLYKSLGNVIYNALSDKMAAMEMPDGKICELLAREIVTQMKTKDNLGLANAQSEVVSRVLDSADYLDAKKRNVARIAFSDSNFFGIAVSSISGAINSGVIKRKMSGLASVISQAHDAIQVVDTTEGVRVGDKASRKVINKIRATYMDSIKNAPDDATRQQVIAQFNEEVEGYRRALNSGQYGKYATETLIDPSNATHDDIFRVKAIDANGNVMTQLDFEVMSKDDYYALKSGDLARISAIAGNPEFVLIASTASSFQIATLSGIPRNLRSSRFMFKADDGSVFTELDFDSARAIHYFNDIKNGTCQDTWAIEAFNKAAQGARRDSDIKRNLIVMQQQDFAAAQGINSNVPVFHYNGQNIIGKGSVDAGEVIMSNVNRHKFGLESGDDISKINAEFFKARFAKGNSNITFTSKQQDFLLVDRFGDHVYVMHNDNIAYGMKNAGKTRVIDGKEYYVDNHGQVMFEKTKHSKLYTYTSGDLAGHYVLSYDNIEDVHNAFNSGYYYRIAYNTKAKNLHTVADYATKYDSVNLETYNAKDEAHFDRFINNVTASWEQQLRYMGVRIPAQSLQSLMAMRVVGFIDEDVNRVYVPVKKNAIDGSDFS